jgi:hypothetical protein
MNLVQNLNEVLERGRAGLVELGRAAHAELEIEERGVEGVEGIPQVLERAALAIKAKKEMILAMEK